MRVVYQITGEPEPELSHEVTAEAAEELCRQRLFLRKDNRYHALQGISREGNDLVVLFKEYSQITPPEDDGNTRIVLPIEP